VKAAALGADEFSFRTTALMAVGCRFCRGCHGRQCAVDIATQDAALRAKFAGSAAHLSTFFTEIAEDVRRILASIGCRKLCDVVGHTELLQQDSAKRTVQDIDLVRLL
jgi:glutamate synthase domain-containing protein 2